MARPPGPRGASRGTTPARPARSCSEREVTRSDESFEPSAAGVTPRQSAASGAVRPFGHRLRQCSVPMRTRRTLPLRGQRHVKAPKTSCSRDALRRVLELPRRQTPRRSRQRFPLWNDDGAATRGAQQIAAPRLLHFPPPAAGESSAFRRTPRYRRPRLRRHSGSSSRPRPRNCSDQPPDRPRQAMVTVVRVHQTRCPRPAGRTAPIRPEGRTSPAESARRWRPR
jgi:hypothetical protein